MPDQPNVTWHPQAAAAAWITESLVSITNQNAFVRHLGDRLLSETGTRLLDWVDHLAFSIRELRGSVLGSLGFVQHGPAWVHHEGLFPRVYEVPQGARIAIRVEKIEDFLECHFAGKEFEIIGTADAPVRRALVDTENDIEVWVVERHATRRWEVQPQADNWPELTARHRQAFANRPRQFDDINDGFRRTREFVQRAIDDVGKSMACDLFFAAERDYWQARNHAARVQKQRQDKLGMGWANHDHHTYRSSREAFAGLIELLEMMDFECRERFYAGQAAGWGAQVLEQRRCRLVVFADVDLAEDEVTGDFAHQPLPPRDSLGTVGLWCRLHGEAIFAAGMHHLECQFDFAEARSQLSQCGIESMEPFTDFPHLKQAFTVGEVWRVDEKRIELLRSEGLINEEQAHQFEQNGALGSHLEVLERNDGYKGFNQTGISQIIRQTDPRK